MKVLLSAYACEPGRGSEPEVGLQAMLAAAGAHEVWVLTRTNNLTKLKAFLESHPLRSQIHLLGFDLGPKALRFKRYGHLGLQWYYDRWQAEAGRRAVSLDHDVGFDIVHHITFAAYWSSAGAARVPKPLVWGPVGGGVSPLFLMAADLGFKGMAEDAGRLLLRATSSVRPKIRRIPRVAAVTLVQNAETMGRLRRASRAQILPNATATSLERPEPRKNHDATIVCAGRLAPWKGAHLAIRTLRYVRHPEARLRVYGDGPDRRRLERAIRRWGLEDRVMLMRQVPREELLSALSTCAVLLHPAMHDDSPLTVAEALSMGSPVVALDRGGPRELTRFWPRSPCLLVQATTPEPTAKRLAAAVDSFLDRPIPPRTTALEPTPTFETALLAAYQRAAASGCEAC